MQQVVDEGRSYSILSSIINHSYDGTVALPDEDAHFTTLDVTLRRHITTKGWKMKVEWKDSTSLWIPLKLLKESNPIEVS